MYPLEGRLPQQVSDENADLVLQVLDEAGVPYTLVRTAIHTRTTIAVSVRQRSQVLQALQSDLQDKAVYVATFMEYDSPAVGAAIATPMEPLARERRPLRAYDPDQFNAALIRVWRFYLDEPSGFVLGHSHACEIEFWQELPSVTSKWRAPRANVAGDTFSDQDVTFAPRSRQSAGRPSSVFDLRMIDDIDFPIDVVYTWVDSSDPAWREKFQRFSGRVTKEEFHEEASVDQRFRSRDELRYSLRSLSMYAPWVRHVYIVTDGQVPEFVDFSKEDITLVDHREISKTPDALPVFNSSAIISWLHRIPGLSEHYIYMNDDVFMGRDVAPSAFFTPSGIAKVFPSNNRRPFGEPTPKGEPHINITRNIRALLEQEFGRSISRSVKHTPHAQLVSVQYELEKRFPDAYERTSRSRFRHHLDVAADQLFHYYAQITGHAIVGSIRYAYVNIGDRRHESELKRVLDARSREVFCLNDVPTNSAEGMSDQTVRGFLESYFPVKSRWEI